MNNQLVFEIQSITKEIEKNSNILGILSKGKDPMDKIMVKQFNRQKRNLYKELAAKLIQSNLNISHYENLYNRIMDYLKKEERQVHLPKDIQHSFTKAEQLLAI